MNSSESYFCCKSNATAVSRLLIFELDKGEHRDRDLWMVKGWLSRGVLDTLGWSMVASGFDSLGCLGLQFAFLESWQEVILYLRRRAQLLPDARPPEPSVDALMCGETWQCRCWQSWQEGNNTIEQNDLGASTVLSKEDLNRLGICPRALWCFQPMVLRAAYHALTWKAKGREMGSLHLSLWSSFVHLPRSHSHHVLISESRQTCDNVAQWSDQGFYLQRAPAGEGFAHFCFSLKSLSLSLYVYVYN